MILSKKIKYIVIILITILLVMFWFGCFSIDSFSLGINADEIYRIECFQYNVGNREKTDRNDIRRIVRRLNSYRMSPLKPNEAILIGETPRAYLELFDEDGNMKWAVVMRGERQIQLAVTPVENSELIGWHRIRGWNGWFAARVF